MKRFSAYEEACNGNVARLLDIYARTIRRARGRLIPRAIIFGLRDQFEDGYRTMAVMHDGLEGSGFFPAQIYAPIRDGGLRGFTFMPPPFFKARLREFALPPPDERPTKGEMH